MPDGYNVCCVVVTFNPDLSLFVEVLRSIHSNEADVVVVDNGSDNVAEIKAISGSSCDFISLETNRGIGAAQNIGAKMGLDSGCEYIWFSDQDTVFPANYLATFYRWFQQVESQGLGYTVLGPRLYDKNRNIFIPFTRLKNGFFESYTPSLGLNECSHIISSGTFVPAVVFLHVGELREDFFIDLVDFEWCWRAQMKGVKIFGLGSVSIVHSIGGPTKLFLGRNISVVSSFRCYFLVRNSTYLLCYSKDVPRKALLKIFYDSVLLGVFSVLFGSARYMSLKSAFRGFIHGISGKLG